MNDMKEIQYPAGFDKEISDKEKKEISDTFFLAYFAVQETIDARVKTDASLVPDDTDGDDFPLIMRVSLDKSDFASDRTDDDNYPYDDYPRDGDGNDATNDDDDDDYPDDGDDNYTADDDDDDDNYTDDDDDNYTDDDTIKVIPLEQFIQLGIEYAYEISDRAIEWQGELLSSQNSVKLAKETYDYVLHASVYAEKAWKESFEKTAELNHQALLCWARVVRANVAFKRLGLLSAHSASVFTETQDADSMLKEALKSYDNAYRLSVARRIVWRNTTAITADAYQKLSLAKERETEASAACVYWFLKMNDALVALHRANN